VLYYGLIGPQIGQAELSRQQDTTKRLSGKLSGSRDAAVRGENLAALVKEKAAVAETNDTTPFGTRSFWTAKTFNPHEAKGVNFYRAGFRQLESSERRPTGKKNGIFQSQLFDTYAPHLTFHITKKSP